MPSLSTIVAEHPDLLTTIVCALARDVGGGDKKNMTTWVEAPMDQAMNPPTRVDQRMHDAWMDLHNAFGGAPPPPIGSLVQMDPSDFVPGPNMSMNPLMPNPTIEWKNWN